MNYQDYVESGYELYANLAETVAHILKLAIKKAGVTSRIQPVQIRAKDTLSLRKKVENRGILDSDKLGDEIKDLAGCRLIFYTNNDVNTFLSSRIVPDNFNVDWDSSKIHQPVGAQDNKYVATHYVVSLTDERLELPEYEKFIGLRCEIQVQSILNHAWAETSHDIAYKKPSMNEFGSREFESIEQRIQNIMTKYLLPAGYEFQKIEQDFEQLLVGKEIFDEGGLDQLKSSNDNNERHDLLERFRDYVLPQYDDIAAAFPDIRHHIVDTILKSRNTETMPIETPVGNYPGHNAEDVTDVALDILESLRYVNIDEMFTALCEIYPGRVSDTEGERILKAAERLASHNLEVWKQAGPYVQDRVCANIKEIYNNKYTTIYPIAFRALAEVLHPEAESTSSFYSSFTFHRASVQPSEALTKIRNQAIDLLTGMYSEELTDNDKRSLFNALWTATRTPNLGNVPEELDVTILDNSTKIVGFISMIVNDLPYDLLQHLEHDIYWLYKIYQPWSVEDGHDDRKASAIRLVDVIIGTKDLLAKNEEYIIFKTLVGYESIFPPNWETLNQDHEEDEIYRNQQIEILIDTFSKETEGLWKNRIIYCASIESNDLATFPHFVNFLQEVAKYHPDIFISWFEDLNKKLERFLPAMIQGLLLSDASDRVKNIIKEWIEGNRYIYFITRSIRLSGTIDVDIFEKVTRKAIDINDANSLRESISFVFENTNVDNIDKLIDIGLMSIDHCTKLCENSWHYESWARSKQSVFLNKLDTDQIAIVLNNLETVSKVDYQAEHILSNIANSHPDMVLEYFGSRLRKKNDMEPGTDYDSIPFKLHKLDKILSKHPDKVVELSRELFEEDSRLFEFRGGRLVYIVFPGFTAELENSLLEQVRNNGIDFVMNILRNYEGETFLHNVVKEIIYHIDTEDERIGTLEIILDSTGVVSGEYGMRDAYIRKKDEVSPWLQDKDDKVRLFAERYTRQLERQIAAEQRRADEDIEMRKREYGEDDE